ncbi:SAF domain-containing protein [Paenibacillus dokdonensis]|uniref:SAF domain-containing protein n=1 Tax=Paenibacillus dokdonensis TaxID=2567944 RepID=A0ABU6GIG1_9BACL|nr:SAF domain-containing protein [Paenibacillus dokdonensis]MEC0239535.1 SAF domain-containing protein [Paenibacillus dokdonensis]
MSKLRQRTKQMLFAGMAGAAVMGVIFAGYAVFSSVQHHARENRIKQDYEQQITRLEQAQLEEEKKMASSWVLARDVYAGEVISVKDLVQVKLPQGAAPVNLVQSSDASGMKIAKIDLKKGTALTVAMIYEQEPLLADLRNRELQAIALPSNLREHDVIDVRVQFPTGQDYIVLSKKKIDKLISPAMWITMTEQEILSLSSAMVDAYLHDAKLYAVTYVEPEMQDKAIPTYPVNKEVLKLIDSDPNIVKKAEQKLSEAVRVSLEKDLTAASVSEKTNQSFADSEFAPTYQSGGTSSGHGSESTSSGFTFEDLKQEDDSTISGSETKDKIKMANPVPATSDKDTSSWGEAQDNKLLEQSMNENQTENEVSFTQS